MQTRLDNEGLNGLNGLNGHNGHNGLNGFLDVPDEGAEAEHLRLFVDGVKAFQQSIDFLVLHDGDDGRAGGRPGM